MPSLCPPAPRCSPLLVLPLPDVSCCRWTSSSNLVLGCADGSLVHLDWPDDADQPRRAVLQDSSRVGRLWSSLTGGKQGAARQATYALEQLSEALLVSLHADAHVRVWDLSRAGACVLAQPLPEDAVAAPDAQDADAAPLSPFGGHALRCFLLPEDDSQFVLVLSVAPNAGMSTGRRKAARLVSWLGAIGPAGPRMAPSLRVLEPPRLLGSRCAAEDLQDLCLGRDGSVWSLWHSGSHTPMAPDDPEEYSPAQHRQQVGPALSCPALPVRFILGPCASTSKRTHDATRAAALLP